MRHNGRDWGQRVRTGVAVAIVAASILGSNSAWSVCLPSRLHSCVDLDFAPQISQQIVAGEHFAAPPKTAPPGVPKLPYNGPTVGFDPMTRRAPTVGYHWSLD